MLLSLTYLKPEVKFGQQFILNAVHATNAVTNTYLRLKH